MAQGSAEILEQTSLPKRKEQPQCHKVSSWQGRQSHLCQRKKEHSHRSKSQDREMRESGRGPHLGERDQSESTMRKEWTSR